MTRPAWQPDFDREGVHYASVAASKVGSDPLSVVCVLDPPRHVLTGQQYAIAQRNIARVCEQVPGWTESVLVGLPEDVWGEAKRLLDGYGPLPDAYLTNGGFGVVYAIRKADPRPAVAPLESRSAFERYKELEASTLDYMARGSAFFGRVGNTFRLAERRHYSPELARVFELEGRFETDALHLVAYADGLRTLAEDEGLDLDSERYEGLALYAGLQELEPQLGPVLRLGEERLRLMREIASVAQPDTIRPRAAWELALIALRRRDEPTDQAAIAAVEDALPQNPVPEPPPEVVAEACRLIASRFRPDMPAVEWVREKNKAEEGLLEQEAEVVSNLLEAAAVLGIDRGAYRALTLFVQHSRLIRRSEELATGGTGTTAAAGVLATAIDRLKHDLVERLARSPIERDLVALRPSVALMEDLARNRFTHDAGLAGVVHDFSVREVCALLEKAGVAPMPSWQEQAEELDDAFPPVREYYEETVVRGKDLAGGIVRAAEEAGARWALLHCDGYLRAVVLPWLDELDEPDLSYYSVMPSWSAT